MIELCINDHVQSVFIVNEQKKASSIIKEYVETQMKKMQFSCSLARCKIWDFRRKKLTKHL